MPQKKIRRKRQRKHSCFDCDPTTKYYKSELKNRRGVPRCTEHIEEYDKKKESWWPSCPQCGSATEFGTMNWGGSIEKTKASCDDCNYETWATNFFARLDIKIIASPLEKR